MKIKDVMERIVNTSRNTFVETISSYAVLMRFNLEPPRDLFHCKDVMATACCRGYYSVTLPYPLQPDGDCRGGI